MATNWRNYTTKFYIFLIGLSILSILEQQYLMVCGVESDCGLLNLWWHWELRDRVLLGLKCVYGERTTHTSSRVSLYDMISPLVTSFRPNTWPFVHYATTKNVLSSVKLAQCLCRVHEAYWTQRFREFHSKESLNGCVYSYIQSLWETSIGRLNLHVPVM